MVGWVLLAAAAPGRGADASPATAAPAAPSKQLVWDAMEKTVDVQPGDDTAEFAFTARNASTKPITIDEIRPTCGCTVAEMPRSPWVLAAGASGTFFGTMDLRGKEGTVTKALFVTSDVGTQMLSVTVNIPTMDEAGRKRNREIAQQDRQAVFQGQCADCHLKPARGLTGAELFSAACGVCHFSPRRASMVQDLLTARQHRDAAFWSKWISEGKPGTLMPAWSKRHGGPLTDEQVDSLVQFALTMLPTEPPAAAPPAGR